MSATAIEWATDVWNPSTGCDRISPGCDHCYALTYAARLKAMGQPAYQADGDPRTSGEGFGLTLHPERLAQRWGRRRDGQRRRIFVNSMSDLFHKAVPDSFVGVVFDQMGDQPEHDFLVLTKRPKRMARVLNAYYAAVGRGPHPNVWLGTSIEDRRYVWRADHLRAAPAAVRFISAEPLLGPLMHDAFSAAYGQTWSDRYRPPHIPYEGPPLDLAAIDWLIVGGESGPGHRPIGEDWIRRLRDAATGTGTAFFFKQWGGQTPKAGGRELDGRTWGELPPTLITLTQRHDPAVVFPVAGNTYETTPGNRARRAADDPLATVHGTLDRAIVVPPMGNTAPRPAATSPAPTQTTTTRPSLVAPEDA